MSTETFTSIRSIGGLLPADLLNRVSLGLGGRTEAVKDLDGFTTDAYHLGGERIRDAANRSWSYLTGQWSRFQDELERRPDDVSAAVTRKLWTELLFAQLGYGKLDAAPSGGLVGDGKSFPISHRWHSVPIHLVGWNTPVDKRTPGTKGAATAAPTSMAQELVNRSDEYLWAIVSNGRAVRLLRDSTSLVRASYVEFDLEAMFGGDLYNEFVLLFALLHQSRFEVLSEDGGPADCWLERWRTQSIERGQRALDQLKDGVVEAINILGTGFIRHPENVELREQLRSGALRAEDYQRSLLRAVYRLLFLFVAEDRGALLDPDASEDAKARYNEYFSSARLRTAAMRRLGTRHGDRWKALQLVLHALGGPEVNENGDFADEASANGLPGLALPGLGGIFQRGPLDRPLRDATLANQDLLAAVRSLCVLKGGTGPRRTVDYRNLDAEELGSVYETLLAYLPRHDPDERTFRLEVLGGNERKTTGSYYTPSSLVECLLDSALEPVLDDAVEGKATREEQEAALLALTVCDPACGSGHFLVAAARRIAKRLAVVRTEEIEPSADDVRHAVHDVIARCIYGVDLNDWAVELAKVSLWMESLEPGKPLSFLDAHIKVGNSLLGVTPKLLADGLPDSAFKPLEGDDKVAVAGLKKLNATEYKNNTLDLFGGAAIDTGNQKLAKQVAEIAGQVPRALADVHAQAMRYRGYSQSADFQHRKEVADAWCAAFVAPKNLVPGAENATARADQAAIAGPWPLTYQTIMNLDAEPDRVDPGTRELVRKLTEDYRFFHWHLEFPEVFHVGDDADADEKTGWSGGFSCVLGNPPWENIELKEQEFFASRAPRIANAAGDKRKKLIENLSEFDPQLDRIYRSAKREVDGFRHLASSSGRYPLCGRGRVKLDPLFAECARSVVADHGRFGMVLPTGIATDANTQYFFRAMVDASSLISFYDFENEAFLLSRDVHHSFHFSLLTAGGRQVRVNEARFAFFIRYMRDLESGSFSMSPSEILLLNPNTGTCPVFRTRRDAEITLRVYRTVPIMVRSGVPEGNAWGISFMQGLFNMTSDSALFVGAGDEHRYAMQLPLYEAKMLHHFDHRLGTYLGQTEAQANMGTLPRVTVQQHQDPLYCVEPRYWVDAREVQKRNRADRGWLIGFRDICRTTDERTVIGGVLPLVGVGHVMPLIFSARGFEVLPATLSAFVFDYIARQKIGGTHLTYSYLMQLPVISPAVAEAPAAWDRAQSAEQWIRSRVLELSYTSWALTEYAFDLGDEGSPFVWDGGRRVFMRAELDAAFFHLYGVSRDDVDHIMETFPIVKRKDEATFGEYRTKRLVLDVYDRMQKAIDTGEAYQTILDPSPGQGPRHQAH
ncbi:Eco57I restriction-modification methylase domain-containing protein [Saccharothrix isguenensis]